MIRTVGPYAVALLELAAIYGLWRFFRFTLRELRQTFRDLRT